MVRRGFDEVREIIDQQVGVQALTVVDGVRLTDEPALPEMVKRRPQSDSPAADIHRFWEQTGSFYARGQGNDNLADPFMSLGVMPASSALFRDMSGIRFEHPRWIGENCTACGNCYTICPDTAIPGLVNEIQQVLDTAVARLKRQRPRHHPPAPGHPRAGAQAARPAGHSGRDGFGGDPAAAGHRGDHRGVRPARGGQAAADEEFRLFREELGSFQFALSRPFFTLPEKDRPGSGGLLSITVDPYRCKGCMECVAVCDDEALVAMPRATTASSCSSATGTSGWTCPTHRRTTRTSTTSKRRPGRCIPCCWTSRPTSACPAATAPAWAAPRKPSSTCLPPPCQP